MLRGFAFVMTVGIIVGTYSSIYVASPFALLWESLFGAGGRWGKQGHARAAAARPPSAPSRGSTARRAAATSRRPPAAPGAPARVGVRPEGEFE